jgi:hypothetical protein
MNSINLIAVNASALEKNLQRLKIVRIAALISLIIIAAISVVVFIINITLPLSSVEKEKQVTLVNLSNLHNKLVKYSFTNDRITNIKSVIAKRKNYASSMGAVFKIIPSGLAVDSISIGNRDLSLTVSAASLEAFSGFIDAMNNLDTQDKVLKNIKIDGLILDSKANRYSLSMEAEIL